MLDSPCSRGRVRFPTGGRARAGGSSPRAAPRRMRRGVPADPNDGLRPSNRSRRYSPDGRGRHGRMPGRASTGLAMCPEASERSLGGRSENDSPSDGTRRGPRGPRRGRGALPAAHPRRRPAVPPSPARPRRPGHPPRPARPLSPPSRPAASTFTYPGARDPAVEDLSLTVAPGEFVVLIGPNGCGKSTAAAPPGGTPRAGRRPGRDRRPARRRA